MKQSLGLVLRGFCMGVADIIPGVSGGTMALILGIYQRLLQSIAALDHRILGDLTRKSFYARILSRVRTPLSPPSENTAEARADAVAFLVVLFAGIASAIVTASRFIPGWMATYPELMRGFFFGLILVSALAPARQIRARRWSVLAPIIVLVALGTTLLLSGKATHENFASGSLVLTRAAGGDELAIEAEHRFLSTAEETPGKHGQGLRPSEEVNWAAGETRLIVPVLAMRAGTDGNTYQPTAVFHPDEQERGKWEGVTVAIQTPLEGGGVPPLWWIFVAGAIAICAMILPGVSGAFLLLLLGQYHYVLFHLRGALGGSGDSAVILVVFLSGIAVGILAFSRLLTRLLDRAHDETMASLVGLMLGSLSMLWPYQSLDGSLLIPGPEDSLLPLATLAAGAALIAFFLVYESRNRPQNTP